MFLLYLLLALAAVRLAWPTAWKKLLTLSTEKETAIYDAERLTQLDHALQQGGKDKEAGSAKRREGVCVIAGGGVAGCIMAAIATRHYPRVIVVEPCQSDGQWHSYIKQYNQLHQFSPFTVEALQRVWPTLFRQEAIKRGGRFDSYSTLRAEFRLNKTRIDWDSNISPFGPTGDDCLMMNRPTLQSVIDYLTKNQTPGVEFLHGKVLSASLSPKDDAVIDKVQVKTSSGEEQWLGCSLFIDCSGAVRVHRNLLKSLNDPRFEVPKVEHYQMNVSYTTALVDVDESIVKRLPVPEVVGRSWEKSSNILLTTPTLTEANSYALMSHADSNRYYISGMRYNSTPEEMPKTLDHYRQYVKETYAINTGTELAPWFDETIDLLQENEEITGQKVHFRQAKDADSYTTMIDAHNRKMPHNLVLVGDSYAKLNPAFGQGTHKAMTDCLTLSSSLSRFENIKDAARDFEVRRKPRSYGLFDFNRAMDLASPDIRRLNPSIPASQGKDVRILFGALLKYMENRGKVDHSVANALFGVMFGATGSVALMHPMILFKALCGAFM